MNRVEIEIPDDVSAETDHLELTVEGPNGSVTRRLWLYYAHFPMQVTVEGDEVVIENFLGERAQRRTPIRGDTDVQIDGETVTLTGSDKEAVGQTAADIEQLTKVTDKDTRVFQDGVYIVEKPTGGA